MASYAQTWASHAVTAAVFYWRHRPALVMGEGPHRGMDSERQGLSGVSWRLASARPEAPRTARGPERALCWPEPPLGCARSRQGEVFRKGVRNRERQPDALGILDT